MKPKPPSSSSSSSGTDSSGPEVGDSSISEVSPPAGVNGESANIRMRLRGLGLAGEYACTMRIAKGFATGKGRLAEGGVEGTNRLEPEPEDGGERSGVYADAV